MPTNCITKSFTLVPGESFVLPVGAEVLSISDQTSVTSSCVDLTNLEQQKCYVATLGAGFGNIDRYFLGNHSTVIGIMYNGLYTPFLNNTIYTADSNALFPQSS